MSSQFCSESYVYTNITGELCVHVNLVLSPLLKIALSCAPSQKEMLHSICINSAYTRKSSHEVSLFFSCLGHLAISACFFFGGSI